MRFTTVDGRATLVVAGRGHDLEKESSGRFGPAPDDAFRVWDELRDWAASHEVAEPGFDLADGAGAPSPNARQVLGIGLNYRSHARELGMPIPTEPLVFAKLPSSLTGPSGEIRLRSESVDFEAELVVVISRFTRAVDADSAWGHVAGLTVGQDISDRGIQTSAPMAQLTYAKSAPTFGPTGPWLVTLDELEPLGDHEISCHLNDIEVQRAPLSDLIFGVGELVAAVSEVVDLWPGDLIFTGTPAGCGFAEDPPRYLRPGDRLVTEITGIGSMQHRCVAATADSSTKD